MIQDKKGVKIGPHRIYIGGLSEKGIDKQKNQDAFRIGVDENHELAYIIVADGLGSCKHSDQGSSRIAEIVEGWVINKLPGYTHLSDNVANILAKRMVEEWNLSYEVDAIYDYDTTVHLAVFYKGSILVGGIGDGMILVDYDDLVCKDYIDEGNLFSNVTNSMCSLSVNELLGFEIISTDSYKEHASIIISTDGIADDLIPEKKLTLPGYFRETIDKNGLDNLQSELQDWISDWETESHSDDKTLCYLAIEKEAL